MAIGALTLKQSGSKENEGRTGDWCKAYGDYVALGYAPNGLSGVVVEIYYLNPATYQLSFVDSHNFTTIYPAIVSMTHIADGVIALWVTDSTDRSGKVYTIGISSSGILNHSILDSLTWGSGDDYHWYNAPVEVFHLGGTKYAFGYQYQVYTTSWAYYAYLRILDIPANGIGISGVDNALSYNMGSTQTVSRLVNVSGDVYVFACGSGTIVTCEISSSGVIVNAAIDSRSYATMGYPDIADVRNGYFVVIGKDGTNDGYMMTITISSAGILSTNYTQRVAFESLNAYNLYLEAIGVDGDNNGYFMVDYQESSNNQAKAKTYRVTSTGTFNSIASLVWYSRALYSNQVRKINYETFLGVADTSSGYDLVWGVIQVDAVPPPTLTSLSPNEGKIGRTYDIVVTGTDFGSSSIMDFGSGITVDGVAVIDSTTIHVTITIDSDAAEGYRDVTINSPNGDDTISNGFYVITQENHYFGSYPNLHIPYIDKDESKELHIKLTNLSSTEKSALENGELILEVSYKVES